MSDLHNKGYRTVGIDTQIPWPARERVIEFQGRRFHFLPATDRVSPMIRVETTPDFTSNDADKMILELLSALAWAEQRGVLTTSANWSTAPLDIGYGPMGMIGDGWFDYLPDPPDSKVKLALALYRDGLSVNLTPYKFLGFFKIINVIRDKGGDQKQWIKDNIQHITDKTANARIAAIKSTGADVAKYLYESGRCAVAHAFDANTVVNPDNPADLIRLSEDLPVIRELARLAIERELKVKSEQDFHDEHLYELEGFKATFGDSLVTRIKACAEVSVREVPLSKELSLRLRDRDNIELFESMEAAVVRVEDGLIYIRLDSSCRRIFALMTLDFLRESLIVNPLTDLQYEDDGTPDAAKMILQWAQLHRWWFGGNGIVEIWDTAANKRLGRAQQYIPPVNSRFPHSEFERMESALRARAAIPDPPEDNPSRGATDARSGHNGDFGNINEQADGDDPCARPGGEDPNE